MKLSKWNDWLQLAASLGVIAGLLLVAWELQQNTRHARADAALALNDGFMEVAKIEMQAEFAGLWLKVHADPESLSDLEHAQFSAYLEMVVTQYDRVWYTMNAHDLFDVDTWDWDETVNNMVDAYFSIPYTQQWFHDNKHWMSPGVREGVERALAGG